MSVRVATEATVQWRCEPPDTPGHWWFHGWDCGKNGKPPKTHLVEAFKSGNGQLTIVGNGRFWYVRHEGADGWWAKASLPEPPGVPAEGQGDSP